MSAVATKEKPILFAGPMVRAILDGRKTQTRRLIDLPTLRRSETPGYDWTWRGQAPVRSIAQQKRRPQGCWQDVRHDKFLSMLPYQVGDVLYVRETWRSVEDEELGVCIAYKAGGPRVKPDWPTAADGWKCQEDANSLDSHKWSPSIHMPKWAARVRLEVTAVKVEQLQDISNDDLRSEGVECPMGPGHECVGYCKGLRERFQELWDSMTGTGCQWSDNPVVAAYTVKRINP